MDTVNRKSIACKVASSLGIPTATSEMIINRFLDEVVAELSRGNRLEFRRFGVFQTRVRGARAYRPPSTGARIERGPRRVVKFTPSSVVESAVGAPQDTAVAKGAAETRSVAATQAFLKWVCDGTHAAPTSESAREASPAGSAGAKGKGEVEGATAGGIDGTIDRTTEGTTGRGRMPARQTAGA